MVSTRTLLFLVPIACILMRLQGQRSKSANCYNSTTVSRIVSKHGLIMLGDDLYMTICVKSTCYVHRA